MNPVCGWGCRYPESVRTLARLATGRSDVLLLQGSLSWQRGMFCGTVISSSKTSGSGVGTYARLCVLSQKPRVASLLTLGELCTPWRPRSSSMPGGSSAVPAVGNHVQGGGFHVKTAALGAHPGYFAAKVNANFPDNHARFGLPTIQGVIALFDLASGRPLALLDSIEITSLRTAAASAVAARHLARADARAVTSAAAEHRAGHLAPSARSADASVCRRRRPAAGVKVCRQWALEFGIDGTPNEPFAAAIQASDICVTCTPAHQPILQLENIRPGLFIAAVGADSPHKQELEPAVLGQSKVVVDVVEQAASIGELHHAIDAGVMTAAGIHAELGPLSTERPVRTSGRDVRVRQHWDSAARCRGRSPRL